MARFAPVAPAHIVAKLPAFERGDYHLLLAHDVVANPKAYGDLFNHYGMEIIMDNSVIELGGAVPLPTILEAAKIVQCSTVVLPDVLLDGKATVESCSKALDEWGPEFEKLYGSMNKFGFMYVPQGKTIEEWAASAQALCDDDRINYWGIPRNLLLNKIDRRLAVDIAYALNPGRRIHLLGFSDDVINDVVTARDRRVLGIDSAVPLRAATHGIEMAMVMPNLPPRGNWWDVVQYDPMMATNIERFKRWIRL